MNVCFVCESFGLAAVVVTLCELLMSEVFMFTVERGDRAQNAWRTVDMHVRCTYTGQLDTRFRRMTP